MLGGLQPVIIFQFSKLAEKIGPTIEKIPIVSSIPTLVTQPPIPFYVDEQATGILIEGESKSIMIQTETETASDGGDPTVNQKGISSDITIKITGRNDALGITLLTAFLDQVFDKATSKEYAISYFHGPMVILRALLVQYSAELDYNTNLLTISVQITKGEKQPTKTDTTPTVEKVFEVAL